MNVPQDPATAHASAAGARLPPIAEYIAIVREQRWLLCAAIVIAALAGCLYLIGALPVYEADAVVQVDERDRGLLGKLDEIPGLEPQARADTEIEILRSRSLLGSVVGELSLDVAAAPKYLPVLGRVFSRLRDDEGVATPFLGLRRYAWGGERIQVTRLEVPRAFEGKQLTLVAAVNGEYEVFGPSGLIVHGHVGRAADTVILGRGGGAFSMFVSELVAREGTSFVVTRFARSTAINDLQRRLAISEKGRSTGVIRIGLAGTDPDRVAATLNAIARTYLRQNVEQKSAEAEKTLEFIDQQLPILKGNVDASEATLSQYRATRGSAVDLSLETRALLERAAEVEKHATELALTRAELEQKFTSSHPTIAAVRQKEGSLAQERSAIDSKIRVLPESEMQAVRLQRDVKVANELYVLLLNKAQELRIMKSGTIGNVRILDAAVTPNEAASPKPLPVLLISLALGCCVGLVVAVARSALRTVVDDPDAIERDTGLSVYASVPHSEFARSSGTIVGAGSSPHPNLLAAVQPKDLAVESLRSVRTSIQFAMSGLQSHERSNVIALVGPSPGVGKSFVSANLAYVLASLGRRVAVIDTDLRKGRLHQYYSVDKTPGLADVIYGETTLDAALKQTSLSNLSVLPMGKTPPNPSELLSSKRFSLLIDELSERFDIVLLDTAPILAVADAGVAARAASLRLLVLRASQHSMHEIVAAMKRLSQNGVTTSAVILNDVHQGSGRYARYAYHYRYE